MTRKTYKLIVKNDVVGRLAVSVTQFANSMCSDIYIQTKDKRCVNSKSLLGLLSLGINQNDKIKVIIKSDERDGEMVISEYLSILSGDAIV